MGKCLRKSLMQSINNENLPMLDYLTLEVKAISQGFSPYVAMLLVRNTTKIKAINGAAFVLDSNDLEDSSKYLTESTFTAKNTTIYVVNQSGNILIYPKYELESIISADLTNLQPFIYFDTADLVFCPLKGFRWRATSCTGDIANLGKIGTLDTYGGAIAFNIRNSAIHGNVEDFVSERIDANPLSINSEFMIDGLLTNCKFGGEVRESTYRYYNYIKFASKSKIACICKESTSGDAVLVYTKGYTQEEAEEEFPNATIVRVDA